MSMYSDKATEPMIVLNGNLFTEQQVTFFSDSLQFIKED